MGIEHKVIDITISRKESHRETVHKFTVAAFSFLHDSIVLACFHCNSILPNVETALENGRTIVLENGWKNVF